MNAPGCHSRRSIPSSPSSVQRASQASPRSSSQAWPQGSQSSPLRLPPLATMRCCRHRFQRLLWRLRSLHLPTSSPPSSQVCSLPPACQMQLQRLPSPASGAPSHPASPASCAPSPPQQQPPSLPSASPSPQRSFAPPPSPNRSPQRQCPPLGTRHRTPHRDPDAYPSASSPSSTPQTVTSHPCA